MSIIAKMMQASNAEGYFDENAEAKVCQDLVLKALSESSLCRNATIKGGVVMRSLTGDARRATRDMDIDFIRYSLDDASIRNYIAKLNCLPHILFEQVGKTKELRQQDYHGKSVNVRISDDDDAAVNSKIDFGVHNRLSIEQDEYCFDIACFDKGANLLINSKEQIVSEKLRSLLKFGSYSTRYKDIFDLCYLIETVNPEKLMECLQTYIFEDTSMREKNIAEVCQRIDATFKDTRYADRVAKSRQNWLEIPATAAFSQIQEFLQSLVNIQRNK